MDYELFLVTRFLTFVAFVAAIWLHVPDAVKAYVWVSIGLLHLDRLFRACNLLYLNLNVTEGE